MVTPGRTVENAWQIAASVPDPELPMLTLADLGILRDITLEGGRVIVSLTPTYSGCPAMHEMRRDVSDRLKYAPFSARHGRPITSAPMATGNWLRLASHHRGLSPRATATRYR